FKAANRPSSVELFERLATYNQRMHVEKRHFGATSNVFTKREVFDKAGLFDGTLKSGGDSKWGNAVFRAGYQIIYGEDVIVFHPARAKLSELIQRHRRIVGGFVDKRMKGKVYTFVQLLRDIFRFSPTWKDLTDRLSGIKGLKVSRLKMFSVFLLLLIVRSVCSFERMRIWAGGESRRS
ncbi:MAG TPA: hypothetical protein VD883_02325, partial [Candidatus Omnitrophota bacterium]|nr:hypothetical protein [Candidatus Omnitrophota bacterium]